MRPSAPDVVNSFTPRKVTVALASEPNVLDVTKAAAGVDWYYIGQVNEQLDEWDHNIERKHALAESWKLTQENGNYIIDVYLKKGIKFHTGDIMTSKDWVFAYDRLKDPKISGPFGPLSWEMWYVRGISFLKLRCFLQNPGKYKVFELTSFVCFKFLATIFPLTL